MSRHIVLLATALLGAACASVPAHQPPEAVRALGPADETFGCAMRLVNELRYEVVAADRTAGFIRARRETSNFADLFIIKESNFDVLTVTIYPSSTGAATILRVLAGGEARPREEGSPYPIVASEQGTRDAGAIRRACGDDPEGAVGASGESREG